MIRIANGHGKRQATPFFYRSSPLDVSCCLLFRRQADLSAKCYTSMTALTGTRADDIEGRPAGVPLPSLARAHSAQTLGGRTFRRERGGGRRGRRSRGGEAKGRGGAAGGGMRGEHMGEATKATFRMRSNFQRSVAVTKSSNQEKRRERKNTHVQTTTKKKTRNTKT